MKIETGVVVLYFKENTLFPENSSLLNRIGCVLFCGKHTCQVNLVKGSAVLQKENLIPLFKVSDTCENGKDPAYVIDVFKDQIIEALVRILLQMDDKTLRKAVSEVVAKK